MLRQTNIYDASYGSNYENTKIILYLSFQTIKNWEKYNH